MRKTMLDMATKLGFDISTPQERQLQNLMDINQNTTDIKIIIDRLVAYILRESSFARPSGAVTAPTSLSPRSEWVDAPSSAIPDPQSSLPGIFNGMGGPREAFPLPEEIDTTPYEDASKGLDTIRRAVKDLNKNIVDAPPVVNGLGETVKQLTGTSAQATNEATESLQQNNNKLGTIVPQWGKNLGQAVTGLSLASSAVIGIVGGFQNIKQGGAGNIFSGIGSILTTIGGIGLSAAGMMKPSASGFGSNYFNPKTGLGAAGPNFGLANGGVIGENNELMKFANGGILQSPTLFNFEDAGVSRTGQAGEAGPEAIMPLKRTKDGRLGVEADLSIPFEGGSLIADEEPAVGSLDPASVPFQREGGGAVSSASMPFQGEGGRNAQQRLGVPFERSAGAMQQPLTVPFMKADGAIGSAELAPSTDTIKFESTVINSVEYVTRTEAEQIGRASAARGADLAQRRIKNNPQIRRSIGV
jgi:hypothetical protein